LKLVITILQAKYENTLFQNQIAKCQYLVLNSGVLLEDLVA